MLCVIVGTSQCNLNCEYCLHHKFDHYPRNETISMDLETFKNIIKENPRIESFEFTGGEPMLNQKIIQYALENTRADIGILTNGTVPPNKVLDSLLKDNQPRVRFFISIDSVDAAPKYADYLKSICKQTFVTAMIDMKDINNSLHLYRWLKENQYSNIEFSPDYFSPYNEIITRTFINFGKGLSALIAEDYLENGRSSDLRNLSTFFALKHGLSSKPHKKTLRFAPDGRKIPVISVAALAPNIVVNTSEYAPMLEASAQFHYSYKFFNNEREFDKTTHIAAYYNGLICETIINELTTIYPLTQVARMIYKGAISDAV